MHSITWLVVIVERDPHEDLTRHTSEGHVQGQLTPLTSAPRASPDLGGDLTLVDNDIGGASCGGRLQIALSHPASLADAGELSEVTVPGNSFPAVRCRRLSSGTPRVRNAPILQLGQSRSRTISYCSTSSVFDTVPWRVWPPRGPLTLRHSNPLE